MRPLHSIPELEGKLTIYQEGNNVISQELQAFEVEYDDLHESSDILKNCWDKNSPLLKQNRRFDRELRTLKADVAELKQEYEDCFKLDPTRYQAFIIILLPLYSQFYLIID